MYRLLISGWLLLGVLHPQEQSADAKTGSICGTVLDETGAPAGFTRITAVDMGPHSGMEPYATTDGNGDYCITGVRAGEYAMSASDPEKGYPEMSSMFYSGRLPGQHVRIVPAALNVRMDWRIPYRAGFLRLILTDSGNGKLISAMSTELYVGPSDNLRYRHASEGSDQVLLVPPNEDIHLRVSAPGYEAWPEGQSQGRLINLLPGQHVTLEMSLRPKTS